MANALLCGDGLAQLGKHSSCDDCILWELRLQVAVRATYYLALHIRETDLRIAVLEEITVAWAECVYDGAGPEGFQKFFAGYCADVERLVDPSKKNTPGHPAEYRRVWTSHARRLHEANIVTPGATGRMA